MFEFDFLPVGDGERSGDAICVRFTSPTNGSYIHGVIDAGFEDDGDAIVRHVNSLLRHRLDRLLPHHAS